MADAKSTHRRLLVLDASMALSLCFADETSEDTEKLLILLRDGRAIVPSFWHFEIANGLLSGERRKWLSPKDTESAIALLRTIPLEQDYTSGLSAASNMIHFGRLHSLSAYDAAYLELSLRLRLPLATLDKELRKAAKKAGVKVLPR